MEVIPQTINNTSLEHLDVSFCTLICRLPMLPISIKFVRVVGCSLTKFPLASSSVLLRCHLRKKLDHNKMVTGAALLRDFNKIIMGSQSLPFRDETDMRLQYSYFSDSDDSDMGTQNLVFDNNPMLSELLHLCELDGKNMLDKFQVGIFSEEAVSLAQRQELQVNLFLMLF